MSRKIYLILSLLLIAAFAFSGCASPAAETESPTEAVVTEPTKEPVAPTEEPMAPTEEPVAPTEEPAMEPVTITWWHISTAEEHKAVWQSLADEYMALHPNVTIEITVLENEAFKTKLTTVMQSGEPPDIFQSWGGGVMNEYANAGLLKDITPDLDADGGAWRNTFAPGALGATIPFPPTN